MFVLFTQMRQCQKTKQYLLKLASAVFATSRLHSRSLETSPERELIHNALGRIKQLSLKRITLVLNQSILTSVIGDHISDIDVVTDADVDLRNFQDRSMDVDSGCSTRSKKSKI